MSKRRSESVTEARNPTFRGDEFDDDGLDDDDLVRATFFGDLDFDQIENYVDPVDVFASKNAAKTTTKKLPAKKIPLKTSPEEQYREPKQLGNGKWACNHKCKDKTTCKHLCCKDGVDKQTRKSAKAVPVKETALPSRWNMHPQKEKKRQSTLQLSTSKRKSLDGVEVLDLTQQDKKRKLDFTQNRPQEYRDLHQLHTKVQKKNPPTSITTVMHKKPDHRYSAGGEHLLSFLDNGGVQEQHRTATNDYSDIGSDMVSLNFEDLDGLKDHREQSGGKGVRDQEDRNGGPTNNIFSDRRSDTFGDEDSLFSEAIVGLADSHDLQAESNKCDGDPSAFEDSFNDNHGDVFGDELSFDHLPATSKSSAIIQPPKASPKPTSKFPKPQIATCDLDFSDAHGPPTDYDGLTRPQSILQRPALQEPKHSKGDLRRSESGLKKLPANNEEKENSDKGMLEEPKSVEETVLPDAYKDLEPWLFAEFGDIVELV
jgi:ATP-dependent DNA helicase HFM1/MER3